MSLSLKIKWLMNFLKLNAKTLEDIYNQEIYSYLNKRGEEKFLKILEDFLKEKR